MFENNRGIVGELYTIIKDTLKVISDSQRRIADAQERRAAAEERKATALEKKAETQMLMTASINELVSVLSSMNTGAMMKEVLGGRKAESRKQQDEDNSDVIGSQEQTDIDDLLEASVETLAPASEDMSEILDDSEEYLEEEDIGIRVQSGRDDIRDIDDIDALIPKNSDSTSRDLDDLIGLADVSESTSEPEIDDLNELLGSLPETAVQEPDQELDDLAALVEDNDSTVEPELDDLNDLLEDSIETEAQDPDDTAIVADDNLSPEERELDDLNELIGDKMTSTPPGTASRKDIAELSEKKVLKKEKLKGIPEDYKSKIIALIIQMKEKKEMSIEASTSYLNQKGYKTISGAEKWNYDMVQEIYNHINHVRAGKPSP